jgi:hypothetical protein
MCQMQFLYGMIFLSFYEILASCDFSLNELNLLIKC